MRRSKAEVERYIASLQSSSPSPREKSIKGFFFAKLYFEAKEYELAKRYLSAYLNVQERDPKAHKFLGQLYEADGYVDKAVGCYKRSVDLNPTQKDLVLKIAELLCNKGTTDGRAEYWLDRAAKLFSGSPVIYKLKEQLLRSKGEIGWNQLFDLIQSELFARPDDVYINIKLVELYQSNEKLEEAVNHCLKVQKKGMLQNSLEWCFCVVKIFKEYLESAQGSGSERNNWRTINRELLLAHSNCVRLTLSSRNVQESRRALESFDHALQFLKPYVNDSDELSVTFLEMRGHFYMHTGTLLLKAAQVGEVHWRAVTDMAALCYLIAFQVPKPKTKSVKGDDNNQDLFEMLAFDRQSQAGHMLLNLSLGKQNFFKEVVETFANKSGQNVLLDALCENQESMEWSFLSSDDIRNVDTRTPEVAELIRCDNGTIRLHNGNLQHLTWLGLQWHSLASLPAFRKWLKQLFPRLPQETARLDTNAPESICIIDLEVFLLAVVFSSHLQLQDSFNIHHNLDQPRFLPLPLCKQLCTEKQKSWWDAVYSLIHKKAQSGNSAKLRLIVQHGLTTLRVQEKHGLQPAVLVHWARSLHKTVSTLNSFYDQRDYMGRCVHYWKKILPVLEMIKKRRSVPEPTDPLFKHFHSQDIQASQVKAYEDEAQIAFATLDLIDGKMEDAIQAFEAIKNVNSYWNLALIFQRKSEDLKSDSISPEEHEEYKDCLRKCKIYLMKIMDENAIDDTIDTKLLVSIETVREMLDSVMQELGEYGDGSPFFGSDASRAIHSEIKHSTPSPTKFSMSPNKGYKFSPKTPPHWAEDQKSLLQILCHQVEALKNEVQELKLNSGSSASHRWPNEGFETDSITDGYQGTQNFQGAPLTVSTSGPSVYYNQSPAYNSQYLLRPAANGTPTKAPMYGVNRLGPQQHVYTYPPQMHTSPLQNTSACMFPQEIYGTPLRFESPTATLVSPRGEEYYNYSVPQTTTNPSLPEPGYFTKPSVGPQVSKTADLKNIEFGKPRFGHSVQPEGVKPSFTASTQIVPSTFKFNSNFKSNDGDFTFSSPQVGSRNTKFTGNESLLGLLTSDSPLQDQGQNVQKTPVDKTVDQRSIFSFGSKATEYNQHKSVPFNKGDNIFSFQDVGKTSFDTSDTNVADRSHDSDGRSIYGTDDDGPHFEPVVPLPDKVEVKTGEEDEEELFSNRAKLFRFDTELKEWKERGVGNVKILRHKISGKIRLLMRRDQVLKICLNHYINTSMKLKPNADSDKSFVWHAFDYADEMPKPEQLAIRFKTPEEAALFKYQFEEAQKLSSALESSGDLSDQHFAIRKESCQNSKDPSTTGIINFGFNFTKKPEWYCDVCLVRNTADAFVCVACQSPRPDTVVSETAMPAIEEKFSFAITKDESAPTAFTFTKAATHTAGFGEQFTKKDQWNCNVCLVANEGIAKKCVACENPNPNSKDMHIPLLGETTTTFKIGTFNTVDTFGSAFAKKEGQWDCSACLVRNQPSVSNCIACRTPNTNIQTSASIFAQPPSYKFDLSNIASATNNDFGALFSKKAGQWDCSTCLVRNEETAANCVACSAPHSQSTPNSSVSAVQPTTGFTFASSMDKSNNQQSGFEGLFSKKEGQWDCDVCLVRNESSSLTCVACQTPNPSGKSGTVASSTQAASAFTFGLREKSENTGTQLGTGFSSGFSDKGFKFGHTEEYNTASSFTFQILPNASETKLGKDGFSFSTPGNAGGFKFGIQEPNQNWSKTDQSKENISNFLQSNNEEKGRKKTLDNTANVQSQDSSDDQKSGIIFGQNSNTFTFADLAKTSPDSDFNKKDPNFKGFSRAGEKLFSSQNMKTADVVNTSEHESSDDMYKTEDNDDIHFEPVVQLPDKIELVTGEEDEKVLYSQRVKLFRFDAEVSQWKERGVGNLKILKNEVNGKLRMLMRREQVLKVCANHWITTTMNLKPLSGSDRAWMWLASDFSDGDAKLEQLAAKFKTPEQAEDFKLKFEECQRLLLDIPLQTPHKLVDTGRTAELIQKAEEMKSGLKHLKTFLTEERTNTQEEENKNSLVNVSSLVIKAHGESTGPTLEWDNYDLREEVLDNNLDSSVYASPLDTTPEKKHLFRFGESTAGFSFNFQPALSPSKSPTKLNQSRVSVGTDEESDTTQEEERDGQYFEPVVPLPDLVEVASGEENEQVVFCHRAKLYRFDKDTNQWKERGIGDIKILQNYDNKTVRIVMRRDQVLKLCANHRIVPNMTLEHMKGTERAWVWTAHDFAEGEGKLELFAVRFKLQDVADSFKQIFDDVKQAQQNDTLITPLSSRDSTPKTSPCGKIAVAVLEETTRERTDQNQEADDSSVTTPKSKEPLSSEFPTKAVVSPPKFVFGSESVKSIFSCEKPKPFTFGNTSSTGSLFGFSFNSSKSQSEKDMSTTKNVTEKQGDFSTKGSIQEKAATTTKPSSGRAENSVVSSSAAPSTHPLKVPEKVYIKKESETEAASEDVIIVYELTPTPEQKALAESLHLPKTFFCYKNRPDYISDEAEDDEDFETAVKKLNGRLYPDDPPNYSTSQYPATGHDVEAGGTHDAECIIIWEKKPTPEEKAKAENLKLPPTFFCGVSSDTEEDKDNLEDFDAEVRKVKDAVEENVSSSTDKVGTSNVETLFCKSEEPDSTSYSTEEPQIASKTDDKPVDLSTKSEHCDPDSTSQGLENVPFPFGFGSTSKLSFADLASNSSGDFAFGHKDENFKWANTGAIVFGSQVTSKRDEDEDADDDTVHNDDIHFEPIVSLPEVEVQSGEEDEEILFKERAKLYRWDREVNQWKERGVGEIKILFHSERQYYRILMRRDQVLKVCANHLISTTMEIKPLNTSNNALTWIATDYADGEAKFEHLAVKFKTEQLMDSFKKIFEECQQNLLGLQNVS
ncbi:E3 SUMO-protein ligase RanBP2 isoform X2 [Microcaecilia unicolor]|uniref:RanBP2-like and GRIP domain-containing protein 4 isoform X2 n=1 Tax=Microcaecilia unicolor TaxID=1415580 RepID=A0A6P7XPQ7_9AMPH|nr:ranBP2-like and GRIP domain-containing protein 4 isoform X2 [Microcaecilia unicolor]